MACVAAFDFDGTLTRRDTIGPFLVAVSGSGELLRGLPRALPVICKSWSGLLAATPTKERLFRIYLGGRSRAEVSRLARVFAERRLPLLIRREGAARLRWHQERGDRCIVVTASPEIYVRPWAEAVGVELIASRLEVDHEGRLTGNHEGPVCEFEEKSRRLRAALGASLPALYAYGDSGSDRSMLTMAQFAYYRRMPPPGIE